MKSPAKKPVLIANRGEIAIRIARTCKAKGFPTVAIYSDADVNSEYIRYCDQAYRVGEANPKDSYLAVDKIIEIAKKSGAGFIHPGYGFLSERAAFADAVEKAGIKFVGPTAESMKVMGDKIQARMTVDKLKVPRVPGSAGVVKTAAEAEKIASQIGFPILLKAAAGGGGKGMRRVDKKQDIESAFAAATRESTGAFGDGSLYVEKLVLSPHHVEIQVFGDGKGGGIHLGERECSIQRRHQKVWEETPSPLLNKFPKTREAMFKASMKIVEAIKYRGAGTLEFIVDEEGNFYFLEMNTRLQVEHPVTEWVTGVDLVGWQLDLADGTFKLEDHPERTGSSIEVRLYAEDPVSFLPAPGAIGEIDWPSGPFVRVDTGFLKRGEVSLHYDPMIAKISTWGRTRDEALQRIATALHETRVEPPRNERGSVIGSLKTNLSFLKKLTREPRVLAGDTSTDLVATMKPEVESELSFESAVALSIFESVKAAGPKLVENVESNPWFDFARKEAMRSWPQ
jgi:acetyl-CoA carboxylase, biotin carboxylase subunit